jgi:hypothetical protein
MADEIENIDSPNDEVAEPETAPEVGLPADPIEVEPKDDVNADNEALKQRNQELYEQLKKAKGLIRDSKTGHWVKKEQPKPQVEIEGTGDVTKTELYSLVKANVPDEDVNEAVIYARSHKMTVTEALKTPELKAILKVKGEIRATAEATNTKNARYGSSKPSDEQLRADIAEGKLPDANTVADLREKKRLETKRN